MIAYGFTMLYNALHRQGKLREKLTRSQNEDCCKMSVITLASWRPLPLGDRVKECELQIKKTWSKTLGYATRRKRNLLRSTSKCSAQRASSSASSTSSTSSASSTSCRPHLFTTFVYRFSSVFSHHRKMSPATSETSEAAAQ